MVPLIRRGKVVALGGDQACVIETGDMLVYIRDENAAVVGVTF